MESLISSFHLNWQLMLAKLINFGAVFLVLWFFVFKPLSRKMRLRTKKISRSLKEAAQISQNLEKAQSEKAKIIHAARKAAQKIIEQGQKEAKIETAKILGATRQEAKKILDEQKSALAQEKIIMLKSVKADASDLIIGALNSLLPDLINEKMDQAMIGNALKKLQKEQTTQEQ